MADQSQILSILAKPGTLTFASNLALAQDFTGLGGRVSRQPSGHLIFYSPENRRLLATDPDGHPLHECEWAITPGGAATLIRARLKLDWGQWVGLKPGGLVNSTALDLSKKPGWQRLRADDLRRMAAQAMQVPFEEIKFFYGDDDLVITAQGLATIRHKKDAFYVLPDGTFAQATFMACMGAMHWSRIDFLPVVELFQSLLPGTGSAMLELIRGLYDDQNEGQPQPVALRYRGIPTYPSEAAYRLFSAFFTPQAPGAGDPFPIFMDTPRSHTVLWLPAADPPRRYFDHPHHLCVTVKGDTVLKATKADDSAGLPFVKPGPNGFAPCNRRVTVTSEALLLEEGSQRLALPRNKAWGSLKATSREPSPINRTGEGWRTLFSGQPVTVEPMQAFSAVLIYPDDETEISELASQPFIADYLQDLMEQVPALAVQLDRSIQVLIDGCDAAITTCIKLDRPRTYTIRYRHPAFAQKQAQSLWNQLAQSHHLDWLPRFTFLPMTDQQDTAPGQQYDLIFAWIPFADFAHTAALGQHCRQLAIALSPRGLAFVTGPKQLESSLARTPLRLIRQESVESLAPFVMHRTILPKACLKPGLTLFHLTTA